VAAVRPLGGGGEQPLQQHYLVAVQVGGDGQPADLFPGQRQRALRRRELLAQPDVLLGQLAVLGPGAGQLVLQPGDRLAQRRRVKRPGFRLGRREPPNDLDQQPPGQLIVIKLSSPARNTNSPGNPRSPDEPSSPRKPSSPDGPCAARTAQPSQPDGLRPAQADPVRPLAPHLAVDQPGSFHARQELRERHARARITDRGGQLRAGHPVLVEEFPDLRKVGQDVLARPDGPLSGRPVPVPHVSTLSHGKSRLPTIS
jgi:hypothetical protein